MKLTQVIITLLFVFSVNTLHAQKETTVNTETTSKYLFEFIQANLDSINKYTDQDTIYLKIRYEPQNAYPELMHFYNAKEMKDENIVQVWSELKKYVDDIFLFFPEHSPGSYWGEFVFRLDLYHLNPKEFDKKDFRLPQSKLIKPNSNYTITVNKLGFALKSEQSEDSLIQIEDVTFSSKLDQYNSNLIHLDDHFYALFRISPTSYNGQIINNVDLSIYLTLDKSNNQLVYQEVKSNGRYSHNNSINYYLESTSKEKRVNPRKLIDIEISFSD